LVNSDTCPRPATHRVGELQQRVDVLALHAEVLVVSIMIMVANVSIVSTE
jgi:hypothetical protein